MNRVSTAPLAVFALAFLLSAQGCIISSKHSVEGSADADSSVSVEREDEQDGLEIGLADVPPRVLQTVERALPGIVLREAEIERELGTTVYELEGVYQGYEYEVEVARDGTLLELVREDLDDDDD